MRVKTPFILNFPLHVHTLPTMTTTTTTCAHYKASDLTPPTASPQQR